MMDPVSNSPIVILQDVKKNTLLPIWVGIFEANAIALQIERVDAPRPMTHDLLKNILLHISASVQKVVVTALRENTFYALIHLDIDGERVTVDSRPSDAIALAMRTDAPIYVTEDVISNSRKIAGIPATSRYAPRYRRHPPSRRKSTACFQSATAKFHWPVA